MNDLPEVAASAAPLNGAQPPEYDLTGIESCFHPVVMQYGRPMFSLVMNATLAQQGAAVLAGLVDKHRSNHGVKAVQIVVSVINVISKDYSDLRGWTQEQLAQCARDIERAYATKIVVPGSAIILDH
jgi:hypothetical protein